MLMRHSTSIDTGSERGYFKQLKIPTKPPTTGRGERSDYSALYPTGQVGFVLISAYMQENLTSWENLYLRELLETTDVEAE